MVAISARLQDSVCSGAFILYGGSGAQGSRYEWVIQLERVSDVAGADIAAA